MLPDNPRPQSRLLLGKITSTGWRSSSYQESLQRPWSAGISRSCRVDPRHSNCQRHRPSLQLRRHPDTRIRDAPFSYWTKRASFNNHCPVSSSCLANMSWCLAAKLSGESHLIIAGVYSSLCWLCSGSRSFWTAGDIQYDPRGAPVQRDSCIAPWPRGAPLSPPFSAAI